jgi:ornithine cyclodeaminase/alanine dehydrogenase-like protein (mu-crystallin family)
MIVLNSASVLSLLSRREIIEKVRQALILQESGEYLMPERMHVHSADNTLLLMPCFISDYFSTKLVSVYPANRQIGKPAIYGTLILNDNKTGEPLALMNAAEVTAARTGALGALGARYLAREQASRLGVVGAGIQGLNQALYISEVREIKALCVLDIDEGAANKLLEKYTEEFSDVSLTVARDSGELLANSDIVVTTTTSHQPVLPEDSSLLQGKTYIAIGSFKPEMRELPNALLALVEEIYVDTPFAARESGDLKIPLEKGVLNEGKVRTLGSFINSIETIQCMAETSLFKSVGMALLDLVVAKHLFQAALEQGAGQKIDL